MTPDNANREKVLGALQHAWRCEKGVKAFDLRYEPDRIVWRQGSWEVPVASGVSSGSSYELGRVLEHLQEVTEEQAQLPVNVFLVHKLNGR